MIPEYEFDKCVDRYNGNHRVRHFTCRDVNRKRKYSGLGVAELRRLRQLEEEDFKLKQIVVDLSLNKQMLQDVLQTKL